MAKYLVQIIVIGTQAVGRAFTRALRQEIEASQRAAQQRNPNENTNSNSAATNAKLGMTVQEAMQILNIENHQLKDPELIEKQYKHLFEVNDKTKGGSFYLQSKIIDWPRRIRIQSFIKQQTLLNTTPNLFAFNQNFRRSLCTSVSEITAEKLNQTISKENIEKSIARLKNLRLGPKIRTDARQASIFIPLCHNKDKLPSILFTRRSFTLSKHKGEVCFPGGMEDEEDDNIVESAVREMIEEIGVDRNRIEIYGTLNPIAMNDLALHSVIGYLRIDHQNPKEFVLNPNEVDSIHIVTMNELIDEKNWFMTQWRNGFTTPVFLAREHPRIWGMTASILYILLGNIVPEHFKFDWSYLNRKS
ncbi:Mitochondrial import inner membrane translocase subunit Tim16 [Sarcoptes scabiei]|uniref:Mitochondrial import inner membrane translocase subunit Tim16 n=1 Tax=Sarcoptes scabiei TaxID=52283 RepID=A0A834R2C9_SARSC|nr:Mitochondrial import inner membrane translocase subunit Tim16 [Sarcoptes scabiei]